MVQTKNDQTRTYTIGSPIDFKVRLSIAANSCDGAYGRQNWVSCNQGNNGSVEVTEYETFKIVP